MRQRWVDALARHYRPSEQSWYCKCGAWIDNMDTHRVDVVLAVRDEEGEQLRRDNAQLLDDQAACITAEAALAAVRALRERWRYTQDRRRAGEELERVIDGAQPNSLTCPAVLPTPDPMEDINDWADTPYTAEPA